LIYRLPVTASVLLFLYIGMGRLIILFLLLAPQVWADDEIRCAETAFAKANYSQLTSLGQFVERHECHALLAGALWQLVTAEQTDFLFHFEKPVLADDDFFYKVLYRLLTPFLLKSDDPSVTRNI
jgi:hypothetical protein